IAGPLGGMFPIPHGVACALLLPSAMSVNIRLLREREPDHDNLRRYTEVARILTGNPSATAEAGAAWVADLVRELKIPAMKSYGVTAADLPTVTEKSANANSTKGNAIPLTHADITEILEMTLN
ncbi:MAG: iron-containing alcohol dehydrogenase, partial [Anaerolineae bacterium]|nr:iron-containing alcohol dehydrogenase [Anaerolineae bacterium]